MRNYAGNYRLKTQRPVSVAKARGRVVVQPLRKLFWKTAGGVVLFATCTGVLATFWVGHQIQSQLTSIATLEQAMVVEKNQQVILEKELCDLLATDRLVARAAVQHGLYVDSRKKQHVKMQD